MTMTMKVIVLGWVGIKETYFGTRQVHHQIGLDQSPRGLVIPSDAERDESFEQDSLHILSKPEHILWRVPAISRVSVD